MSRQTIIIPAGVLIKILYNQAMSDVPYRMKPTLLITVLLITGILGWLLFRYFIPVQTPFWDSPPPTPPIVSRTVWDARPLNLEAAEEYGTFDPQSNPEGVLTYPDNLREVLNTVVVHHSAYPNAGPKDIQDLHMDRRAFADVAYHFMIDSDGVIYEGRKINIRGAHVQGYNTGSVGIVLLGNFNDDLPAESQLLSLRRLVDYLQFTYKIQYLSGHKDYPDQSPDGTECPGDNLYPLLPDLARELGMGYGIKGYVTPDWVK